MRLGLGLGLVRLGRAAASFVRNGLKLYYPFKDNSPDFLLNGSTSFDGTDDYISMGNVMPFSSGGFSFGCWVMPKDSGNGSQMVISKNNNTDGYRFQITNSTKTVQAIIEKDNNHSSVTVTSTTALQNGEWYHILVTYDGATSSGVTKLYINGQLEATNSSGTGCDDSGGDLQIGRHLTSSYYNGLVSNAGFWSRELSASEVESIYWRGQYSELKGTELTNLVSWYDLSSTGLLGAEVISNGTMETVSTNTLLPNYESFPEDWTQSYGTLSIQERSSAQAFSGTHSLRFKTNASSRSGVVQSFSVTGSASYRLEFYVYGVTGSTIQITHQTAGGTASTLDGGGTLLDYEQSVTIGEWKQITFDFTTTGSGTVTGTVLQLGSNVSGNEYYIDNVSLKPIGVSAPDSQGSNDGTIEGATVSTDSYSGESPFKPRIQDKAHPKMAVQLADGSTSFDGTDDYISMPFSESGNYTISAWFKINTTQTSGIVDWGDQSTGERRAMILWNGGSGSYKLWSSTYGSNIAGGTFLSTGIWYHGAITVNVSDGSTIIYLNGFQDGSGTHTINSFTGTTGYIGKTGINEFFDGSIANVSIFSSVLTQTQIQELMFTEKYSGLSADLKTNLVSFYDMGSSSNPHNDLEGSNHGTNNGATVNTGYTHSPHGVVDPLNFGEVYSGRAVSFDGNNDYLDTGSTFESTFNSSFTITGWYKLDDGQPSTTEILFGVFSSANGVQLYQTTTGKLHGNYGAGTNTTEFESNDVLFTNGQEDWHHIVYQVDSATNQMYLYVDGRAITLASSPNDGDLTGVTMSDFSNSSHNLVIGARNVGGSISLEGAMDINNFSIYSVTLTQAQIRELYTNPEQVLPTGISASSLKLHYPMQEGSGSYIYDGSGNQNHGTITGATWVSGEEYGYQSSLVRSNTPMIFDADNDFVNLGSSSALDNIWNGGGSVSAWIYPNSDGDGDEGRIIEKRDLGDGWMLYIADESSGTAKLKFYQKYSVSAGQYASSANVNIGKWNHIVLTYTSGTGSSYRPVIYINGSVSALSATTDSVGSVSSDASQDLVVGNLKTSHIRGFDGLITEVAVWDTILDADAVTQLYNSGVPLLPTSDSGNYDNSDSLVGYWRNDSNSTWTDRANTGVASFDGSSYINCGNITELNGVSKITLCAWVKPDVLGQDDGFMSKGNSGNNRLFMGMKNTSGAINVGVSNGSGNHCATEDGVLSVNTWTFVVMVFDGTQSTDAEKLKVYVNNGVQKSLTFTGSVPSTTSDISNNFNIGIELETSVRMFFGQMASSSIFNIALTASEISELYNIDKRSSISGHSQFSNCVGSWLMGAGTGDTTSIIQDQSTANNDGTISGVDLVGYNDGTASGSPVEILIPEGSTEGRDNQGYYLSDTTTISNGIRLHGSEYIEIQDSEVLSFGDGTDDRPFSIETWVKIPDATVFTPLVYKYESGKLEYRFVSYSGGVIINTYDNSATAYIGRRYATALTAYNNQWVHLVSTYSGNGANNGFKIYLNGSQIDDTDFGSGSYVAMENLLSNVEIGRDHSTTYSSSFHDEVRIYSKELSASEVLKNYNSGKSSHQ